MAVPKPTGITVRHAPGWTYMTVPVLRGNVQEVEYDDRGDWYASPKQGDEWLIPTPQYLKVEFRARYVRGGEDGDWTTGRVWTPKQAGDPGIEFDDTPPPAETRPKWINKTSGSTSTKLSVVWEERGDETQWAVRRDGNPFEYVLQGDPAKASWSNLEPGSRHSVEVRCQVDGTWLPVESARKEWFTLDGGEPPPEVPSIPGGIRAHCIHAKHAKVEWDGNPDSEKITHYQVSVDGTSRDVIGTLVELHGLTPETEYSVFVKACRDDVCSAAARVKFRTASENPPPDPDPPSDLAKPTGLYVDPIAAGKVRANWDSVSNHAIWWLVSIDDRVWHRVTGSPTVELQTPPGTQHTVQVYAILDGGNGKPTKISAVVRAGVVTAWKGF